ncbi:MAG: CRISP-associated protein Cas1, partial [Candidatus Poribacteria bacterium]|nr:CRISP-associated protein Cas1 [Candidatus Poribacteria bacterium]
MKRNYYITRSGRLKRKDNTLFLEFETGEKKVIPIEDVEGLYLMGETDLNTKLLIFLAQQKIPLHVFNYYGYYSGS